VQRDDYPSGVNELYQGEVIGEGLTSSLLALLNYPLPTGAAQR
jgi:hypothetical protein